MYRILNHSTFRFVVVGVINTFHYYTWYLIFTSLLLIPYMIAHWLGFLISMIGSFYLNTYFTYRSKPSWKKFFQFPLTYVINISVSSGSLYILKETFNMSNSIAPLLASGFAIPFTYIISRKILESEKVKNS